MIAKILVLASNPQDTDRLTLEQEIREIEEALERAGKREQFSLKSKVAVRIKDLQKTIRQEKPRIVHFCGHGTGSQGLVLETDSGQQQLVNTQGIADLFRLFATQVECVVLNACYSKVQAEAIKQHINYVVGTKKALRDDAALAFSKGFYEALFDGETIDRAYEFGCNRIQLEIYGNSNPERKLVPVYPKTGKQWLELPQHEIIKLSIRDPLNEIRGIDTSSPLSSRDSKEKQSRKILLTKVKKYWLHILEETLSSKVEIELALETRSDLLRNPFSDRQDTIDTPSLDIDIENIFAQWEDGQRLLILGNPGAGKTIALLQLAKKFYNRARENLLEEPIPVVFHLSSWQFGQSIAEWLIQQLDSKYGFPQSQAENWVENRNLCLFLDGFDQVNTEYQQKCVEEINKFGASNIIICSRIQQYETLPKDVRLYIDFAVCIKSLTPVQIDKYLETLNQLSLKKVLEEDEKLLKLAKIPFWLDLMTEIDENLPRKGSSEQRKKKLFDKYIEKTFQNYSHKINKSKYDQSKVIEWLTWLASNSRSKSVFLIEEMQPSWLNKKQKKYYLIAILSIGLILGLVFGIPYGSIFLGYLYLYLSSEQEIINLLTEGIWFGIMAGIIMGTAAQYFLKVHKLPIKTHKEVYLSWEKVQSFLRTSLQRSMSEAIVIGVLLFFFCLFFIPILEEKILQINFEQSPPMMALIIGSFFGLVTLTARLLSNSLVDKKEVKTVKPNQGILNSRKTAFSIAKITAAILAIAITTVIFIIYNQSQDFDFLLFLRILFLGICIALITGPVSAFIHHSGRSCQQHLALRIVLWITGCIPWNYSDFLDYAVELTFLNKIGGGYQFFHGMFKEYLSSPKPNQRNV